MEVEILELLSPLFRDANLSRRATNVSYFASRASVKVKVVRSDSLYIEKISSPNNYTLYIESVLER